MDIIMIQPGERFTFKELQQSMREICDYNIRRYIDNRQSVVGLAIGNSLFRPIECSPTEYAGMCIQEYCDIPSSAINLDNQLRDGGYKTAYHFSYKYDTGGLTSEQIVTDAYRLDWFLQVYNTSVPYKKYEDKYLGALDDALRLSYYYAQYLWAHNPRACRDIANKLRIPGIAQWGQITGALLGIGFQFHPHDVYEYAIKHASPTITKRQFDARYAVQLAFKNEMMEKYGIDTGCLVLSPQNREKLHKIVTGTDMPYFVQIIQNMISGCVR